MLLGVSRFKPVLRPRPGSTTSVLKVQPRPSAFAQPMRDLFRSSTIVSPGQTVSLSGGQPRPRLSALFASTTPVRPGSVDIRGRLAAAPRLDIRTRLAAKATAANAPIASAATASNNPSDSGLGADSSAFGMPSDVTLPGVGPVKTWALLALGVAVFLFVVRR